MLPNFLVIGAEKSGTSWLYDVLRRHPDIYLPDTKELGFFSELDSNLGVSDRYSRLGLSWYEDFFKSCKDEKARGDVSPMYICDRLAPNRIATTIPDVKLIAILRDPVERAASHYWMAYNKAHVKQSLEQVVEGRHDPIVKRGLYGEQIERYLSEFPREQMLVLTFEDVMSDRARALGIICEFIGVDPDRLPLEEADKAVFPSTAYRFPWLHNSSILAATALRSVPFLAWIPRLIKKSGFNQMVKKANSTEFSKPSLPQNLRNDLRSFYADDRKRLEAALGYRIETWPR